MELFGVDGDTNLFAVVVTGIFGVFLAFFSWIFYEIFRCRPNVEENSNVSKFMRILHENKTVLFCFVVL